MTFAGNVFLTETCVTRVARSRKAFKAIIERIIYMIWRGRASPNASQLRRCNGGCKLRRCLAFGTTVLPSNGLPLKTRSLDSANNGYISRKQRCEVRSTLLQRARFNRRSASAAAPPRHLARLIK